MIDCIACEGTGKKGRFKGYIFSCPYCNGTGKLKNHDELRSVGLRCGKIYQNTYQLQLNFENFMKGDYRGPYPTYSRPDTCLDKSDAPKSQEII